MRFFYAHRADAPPEEVREKCKKLKSLLKYKTGREYIKVTPGRVDYERNFRGDWDEWQASVVNRKDSTTDSLVYDAFVICGENCGRATGNILKQALSSSRSVFWWDGEFPGKLYGVLGVNIFDAEDWSNGWRVVVKFPESKPMQSKQLNLPFGGQT